MANNQGIQFENEGDVWDQIQKDRDRYWEELDLKDRTVTNAAVCNALAALDAAIAVSAEAWAVASVEAYKRGELFRSDSSLDQLRLRSHGARELLTLLRPFRKRGGDRSNA